MKILIVNQPLKNRGDESAHKGLVRKLVQTYPEAEIQVLQAYNEKADLEPFVIHSPQVRYVRDKRSDNASRAFHYSLLLGLPPLMNFFSDNRRAWNLIKNSDLIINAPGGICMGGFHNWYHVMILKVAKYLHKPISYYGRSIGPFDVMQKRDKTFNKWSFELLHYFGYLSLRDSISIKIAEDEGIKPIHTTDSAFLDSPKVEIPLELNDVVKEKKYVVVVPNQLTWHYKYASTNPKLIDNFYYGLFDDILSRDKETFIVMLPQTYNDKKIDDYAYFQRLKDGYTGESCRILPIADIYSSDIQQTVISKAEYVIGARYHSIIFAINQNRPFVSLSYEHKMKGLLEIVNATNNMVDIADVFQNEHTVEKAISDVSATINLISSRPVNPEIQKIAKTIASNGFEKFKHFVSTLK